MFAIKVQDLYWADRRDMRDGRCWSYTPWTGDIVEAMMWADCTIPESIIAHWNKVHYEETATIAGKLTAIYSAIGGVRVKDRAEVVGV